MYFPQTNLHWTSANTLETSWQASQSCFTRANSIWCVSCQFISSRFTQRSGGDFNVLIHRWYVKGSPSSPTAGFYKDLYGRLRSIAKLECHWNTKLKLPYLVSVCVSLRHCSDFSAILTIPTTHKRCESWWAGSNAARESRWIAAVARKSTQKQGMAVLALIFQWNTQFPIQILTKSNRRGVIFPMAHLELGSSGDMALTLSLPSSKSTFSQPFKHKMYKWGNENR